MINDKIKKLNDQYEWLKITTTVEDYVEPEYYNKLLKSYIFDKKNDELLFRDYLLQVGQDCPEFGKVLELGCGTGRITKMFLDNFKDRYQEFNLVDLSDRMLKYSKNKFKNFNNIKFHRNDSIKFLDNNKGIYDLIFSLWSFSHSVHQILSKFGLKKGKEYIKNVIKKTVLENMRKNSRFFLIHFDSMSDEQKILMSQWKKVFPIYHETNKQSPSKLLIDEVFADLESDGIIKNNQKYYVGEGITYLNLNEALEIFLNFHMESYFNESKILPQVIDEMTNYFKDFTNPDGTITIKPGCFIYDIKKI